VLALLGDGRGISLVIDLPQWRRSLERSASSSNPAVVQTKGANERVVISTDPDRALWSLVV
jgi:hypothetical protein